MELRVVKPSALIPGTSRNPNRLTLVLGDDEPIIAVF
jgi:hypothetical protein